MCYNIIAALMYKFDSSLLPVDVDVYNFITLYMFLYCTFYSMSFNVDFNFFLNEHFNSVKELCCIKCGWRGKRHK